MDPEFPYSRGRDWKENAQELAFKKCFLEQALFFLHAKLMWELDCKESWVPKNWCFWTVVLEKTLKSPLDCKEFQPVHPKGDQS